MLSHYLNSAPTLAERLLTRQDFEQREYRAAGEKTNGEPLQELEGMMDATIERRRTRRTSSRVGSYC
jgi:hypothetical protein